jgi:hypothetical protein
VVFVVAGDGVDRCRGLVQRCIGEKAVAGGDVFSETRVLGDDRPARRQVAGAAAVNSPADCWM